MRPDRLYLVHIGECLARIRRYTGGGREAFLADSLIQDAVLRNVQTLAESTQRLSGGLKARQPDVPWDAIAALRNVIVHYYLGIDPHLIWEIVEHDLSALEDAIDRLDR